MTNYPISIDTNANLYEVHDALRVVLAEDYNVGDTTISVIADESTMALFNATGIITLTDQCLDSSLRGLSLSYGSRTTNTFDNLQVLEGFIDSPKPKLLTSVVQNVMAEHHNALKDALIATELFAGIKGTIETTPLQGSLEQRVNYIRKIALMPKAWFSANVTTGLVPLTVKFSNQSFRLGDDGTSNNISYEWKIEKNNVAILDASINPTLASQYDLTYTFDIVGGYDISLTVTNDFGTDNVSFPKMIIARGEAPDFAVFDIDVESGNGYSLEDPVPLNGPYTTTPVVKFPVNSIIDIGIRSQPSPYVGNTTASINPNTLKTFSGELVEFIVEHNEYTIIDPVTTYTWFISDDVVHTNNQFTKAIFSVGGIYDISLRCDTDLGSYRITQYPGALDIVEGVNLWLWNDSSSNDYPYSVNVSEFGLVSETFKIRSNMLNLDKNDDFLITNTINHPDVSNSKQQLKEFHRNNGFALQAGSSQSGFGGNGYLYWSSGRGYYDSPSTEKIYARLFNGFLETYSVAASPFPITRPWNWISFNNANSVYFFLGSNPSGPVIGSSPTNQNLTKISLSAVTASTTVFDPINYQNGAEELMQNVTGLGVCNVQGDMSVYRTAWQGETGYVLRNSNPYIENPDNICPNYFRIRSFYKTLGNTSEPFQQITKLTDMIGGTKTEGQLLSLSQGVYFFTNSGSVSAYNTTSGTWTIGGPGASSSAYRNLQDVKVSGFDNPNQTFLATSDNNSLAFLSFDYSSNVFIKFNETDTTFTSVSARPNGKQWQMCIF